jgi:hypothetical protein
LFDVAVLPYPRVIVGGELALMVGSRCLFIGGAGSAGEIRTVAKSDLVLFASLAAGVRKVDIASVKRDESLDSILAGPGFGLATAELHVSNRYNKDY